MSSSAPYRRPSDQLAASPPEVSWQGRRLRVFLPAARLYGKDHGGAVALLAPELARDLAAAISSALIEGPPTSAGRRGGRLGAEAAAAEVGREVPEVLRGVSR